MGDLEHGVCGICGKQNVMVHRKYYNYPDVKCECHSPHHFDLVLVCYPIIRDPFDEKVYVITVMNSKINIEPILTNHVELVALHYSQERRSYTIIKETKAFYKFILRYLQFLSLPNGIT